MNKVIVDVDAGIDDAMALLLLFFAEVTGLVKIVAITCSAGTTSLDHVTDNVVRILETVNRKDIPVYKGSKHQLIYNNMSNEYYGVDGFGDVKWGMGPNVNIVRQEPAAVALGKIITGSPGEISLISLAPLTNLALAIKLHPSFMGDLKDLYIMGGNFQSVINTKSAIEFNFLFDPEAAHIVLNSVKQPLTVTTWDSVASTNISYDWRINVLGKINSPLMDLTNKAEKNLNHGSNWKSEGAFCVAAYLFPNVISKDRNVLASVELHGFGTRGMMIVESQNKSTANILVVERFDDDGLKKLFMYAATELHKLL